MSNESDKSAHTNPTLDYWGNQKKPSNSDQQFWWSLLATCVVILLLVLLVSAIFPGTSRVSESSNRKKCVSNLRAIGKAIEQYQSQFQTGLPESIGALAINSNLVMHDFTCPSSNAERGEIVSTVEQANKTLTDPKFSSYIYCGDQIDRKSINDPYSVVLVYEFVSNHDNDGVHILFLDQRVKFIRYDRNRAKVDQMILDAENAVRPVRLKP